MNYLEKLEKNREGWLLYCGTCNAYIKQSDPQNFSGKKQVIIDDVPCESCEEKRKEEIKEAQSLMGRLGLPKGENSNG